MKKDCSMALLVENDNPNPACPLLDQELTKGSINQTLFRSIHRLTTILIGKAFLVS